jgi:pimeloyl-ACP methyl ester carboxylesterase
MDGRPTCIFLPGIIQPGVLRYAPLIGVLGGAVDARVKELEVYGFSPPPSSFSIDFEIEGLLTCARRAGLERFHLYGHSGGGAVALAFTAAYPQLVLSLTLDEPAFDFSDEMRAELAEHRELERTLLEDAQQAMPRFMRLELRPGVEFQPPAGVQPLPNRPAGIAAFLRAFRDHRVDVDALRSYQDSVLYTRGSLSAERYERSSQRLSAIFPRFREIVFEGVHHLNTSHQAQPERVASLLRDLWAGTALADLALR